MRVLQIIDQFPFGGAERLLATLNGVAPQAGLDMTVASLAPYTVEKTASLPLLQAAGLAPTFIGVRKLLDPTAMPKLVSAIRGSGCDVVHAHLGTSATLVPLAARLAGVPCFSTLHHLPRREPELRRLVKSRLCIRSAERGAGLIFVSQAAHDAAARVHGPARSSWTVLHNGVDLSAFAPVDDRGPAVLPPDLGVPDGVPVVSVVAALRAPKGHEVALRAWDEVRRRVPGAVLLIVGDGEHRAALEAAAGDGVVFAGSREDVPTILRASALALLPSLTEALPTAVIEAAAAGIATVATTVGGTPEIVDDGRTGLLVAPGDPVALGDAVVELLLDPERRARYGSAARRLAADRFDLRRWAQRLAAMYEGAIDARPDRDRVPRAPDQKEST
ncbi:glycosyltransferase [Pseudonocardia hydrocarbonoxydans]|uniref:Glycosyl transferase n=1 Tax=Pseudonocardia hydrocarbonoxydans TaxID=76726 RepID=A0A4Y3WMN9_9PSEU|nr:glycosyltransferase [Pseudonocardia hydrocarbonoxydans]GEC19139.1 glycosyl transferase [Pseudonocardia hydrocarbonoxydans]